MPALNDILQGTSRTFWADGLGAPADMGNSILNLLKAGYGYAGHKVGALRADQMPQIVEKPVGGSAWIAEKMRERGLLRDNPGSGGDMLGLLAGVLLPGVAQAKAPQIARGVAKMGENAAVPSTLGRQRGVILYHGSNDSRPVTEIKGDGTTFDGLFANQYADRAASHGDNLYRMTVPDEKVLTQHALDYDIKQSALRKAVKGMFSGKHAKELKDMVVSSRGAWDSRIPEGELLASLRAADLGEADWELQRLRGQLAKRLGYQAVEMPDEHGMSHLVVGNVKPRPANAEAKALLRSGIK